MGHQFSNVIQKLKGYDNCNIVRELHSYLIDFPYKQEVFLTWLSKTELSHLIDSKKGKFNEHEKELLEDTCSTLLTKLKQKISFKDIKNVIFKDGLVKCIPGVLWTLVLITRFVGNIKYPDTLEAYKTLGFFICITLIFFGIVLFGSFFFYYFVNVLSTPLKKALQRIFHYKEQYFFKNAGKTDVIKIKTPIVISSEIPHINSAEAGLLLHRYGSSVDMFSLIYKRFGEKIITIKVKKKKDETVFILEQQCAFPRITGNTYEEYFFRSLFGSTPRLILKEIDDISYSCNTQMLEDYGIAQGWFHPRKIHKNTTGLFSEQNLADGTTFFLLMLCILIVGIGIINFSTILSVLFGSIILGFLSIPLFIAWIDVVKKRKKIILFFLMSILSLIAFMKQPFGMESIIILNGFLLGRRSVMIGGIVYFWKRKKRLTLTPKGKELVQNLLGFREFLLACDETKLALLSQENPVFYEKTLPYAVVFGIETHLLQKMLPIFDADIEPGDGTYQLF